MMAKGDAWQVALKTDITGVQDIRPAAGVEVLLFSIEGRIVNGPEIYWRDSVKGDFSDDAENHTTSLYRAGTSSTVDITDYKQRMLSNSTWLRAELFGDSFDGVGVVFTGVETA